MCGRNSVSLACRIWASAHAKRKENGVVFSCSGTLYGKYVYCTFSTQYGTG